MKNIRDYNSFVNEQLDERTPFKVGMKIDMVESDARAGKLIFHCENDSFIIEVAPSGGASIVWDGMIEDILDSQITEIRTTPYEIDLSFDNADDLYMADDNFKITPKCRVI